ncbi:MAG: N-acetyltransferase [Gammaproteobacteria bacterium]|nr:N-acetyltransferase [Gammaproteobacteria bacterium]
MAKVDRTVLSISPVSSRADRRDFLGLAAALYRDDPHWIAPLRFEERMRVFGKNPLFEHAEVKAWVARRGGHPLGRITAQIDRLQQETQGNQAGSFGMLEAEDDPEVFAALFGAAEAWLRERGCTEVRGPFNLSINEEAGLLVEGFDTPPCVMMSHGRPCYPGRVEAQGYERAQDLFAYTLKSAFAPPPVMMKLAERAAREVRMRTLRRRDLAAELEILRDIFNDAWAGNWGFVPFTRAEFAELGKVLAALIPEDYVQIAEIDGRPVAFIVALPNVNEAARDLRGRLLPLGWAKLLWRLKVSGVRSGRVPLLGVRREYHHTRLGPTLAFMVTNAARVSLARRGIIDVELSWILEGNSGMRNIIETIGGTAYKRYRIYRKWL